MFSIQEILDLAIQLEINAETLYRRAARQHDDAAMAQLLLRLADEERKHARWFEHQRQQASLSPASDLESELADEMGRNLLIEMVREQRFSLANQDLTNVTEKSDMLEIFNEFETDTILFYNLMLPFMAADSDREGLELIIAEEQRHQEELNGILTGILDRKTTAAKT